MSINWGNIRPWGGSQHSAFEEMCCQLAAHEQMPPGSRFVRKGAPDAGVECFWTFPNGDEWGWQAKFFLSSPNPSQWGQIDHSVKTALDKHPRLSVITVCLPTDRQDPRVDQQEWFMDRWNAHVENWTRWASKRSMSVEFRYWGEHEVWEKLSLEEHRGRHFFWFNEERFSQRWFRNLIEETVSDVGPRYTPELNVELPVSRLFDGLGRTPRFFTEVASLYGETLRAFQDIDRLEIEDEPQSELPALRESTQLLLLRMEEAKDGDELAPIDWSSIADLAARSRAHAVDVGNALTEAAEKDTEHSGPRASERSRIERDRIYKLRRQLSTVEGLARSDKARLSNVPALLLTGDAGRGKTHLFCDAAKRRIEEGSPTLLLLGRDLEAGNPWSRIIQRLGLNLTDDEFLQALDVASQTARSRAVIFVDALNESEDRTVWKNRLAGMLTALSRYPRIGLAVSVRTSYEGAVVPEGLVPDRLVRTTHHGFADHEFQATRTFFDHYGIARPSVPLLVPEFQNPLFLKLFCEGLSNRGLTAVPSGVRGITAVFDFFVESVNEKLAAPGALDFDESSRPVQRAVRRLSKLMADKGGAWLLREEASEAVNCFLLREGYERSLFRHLISEGILAENRFPGEDGEWCDGVHFSYERFSDHLIAAYLLEAHLDRALPARSFSENQPLGDLVEDERACWRNQGLIEALSVQVPEEVGKELIEVAPGAVEYRPVCEAFIESLLWRDPASITETTLSHVNECLDQPGIHDRFLDVLLTLATSPDHPYNADFLHARLMRDGLAERDSWWSTFLHYQHGTPGAVDRLVDWAWSPEAKDHIDDEAVRLCGVALTWFFTSSDRFLRDRATKALVNLLDERIHVLRDLVPKFLEVNDPYVLERLFCVAYGCAMRSASDTPLRELAQDVYAWIFEGGDPSPHLLLRDYARGVIELALARGAELDIEVSKVRPPYGSEWPTTVPTEEELEKYGEWQDGMADEEWARVSLYESVMGHGDFARYVIGTNHGNFPWSSRRLGWPKELTAKERHDSFIESLTARQRKAWERYRSTTAFDIPRVMRIIVNLRESERVASESELAEEDAEKAIDTVKTERERIFKNALGKRKSRTFDEHAKPYLDNLAQYEDELRFDLSTAQRWIFRRVLDLGWSVERFGKFDRWVDQENMRDEQKAERIGKKYQWIAYHEFLARTADNFEFRGDPWSEGDQVYDGPWQEHFRDIDPSLVSKKTNREAFRAHTGSWWFTVRHNDWETEREDRSWLQDKQNLPAIESLIEVAGPESESQWLTLQSYYKLQQSTPPEEERSGVPRREIWYMLKSYLVERAHIEEVVRWAKGQDFTGRWMPESLDLHDVFLGELFWSPAYRHRHSAHYGYEGWTRGRGAAVPQHILSTAEEYAWEPGFDSSIEDLTMRVYLPCDWLAKRMDLRWSGAEGRYRDPEGVVVSLDPSTQAPGPGALLIRRRNFLDFLDDSGYAVLWTLLGEKNILGGRTSRGDWKGRLQISGAYTVVGGRIDGENTTQFVSRGG